MEVSVNWHGRSRSSPARVSGGDQIWHLNGWISKHGRVPIASAIRGPWCCLQRTSADAVISHSFGSDTTSQSMSWVRHLQHQSMPSPHELCDSVCVPSLCLRDPDFHSPVASLENRTNFEFGSAFCGSQAASRALSKQQLAATKTKS